MNARQKDGNTLRVHLELAASGNFPDQDAIAKLASAPEMPTCAAEVWARFTDLHSRRAYNENGAVRLAWSDLQAWQTVRGIKLPFWQISVIFRIDDVFFAVQLENK